MPSKRKRDGEHPAPPAPSAPVLAPRRSNRRFADEASTQPPAPIAQQPSEHLRRATPRSSRDAVELALQDLLQMEHKLQNEVKRQRLAVETSDLSLDTETAAKTALQTSSTTVAESNIPKTARRKSGGPVQEPSTDETATSRGRQGQKPTENLPGHQGQLDEEEDATDEQLDDVAYERGARRPPPLNSMPQYLLKDPSQPEHPTKNRPDPAKPADPKRGLRYIQQLGLANAAGIVKMLRWNDKYGIKFMRLSSEMFPFASHQEHGYKLAPFAAEALAQAGRVAAELGHRLTTHPGQFTQIGSPRKEVVAAAVRDLDFHNELLSLKLPEQLDRDAVMILHMGGVYGDKAATLDRFRQNYATLSAGVKRRLVLENDDVAWSVHDLLPVCEELKIPLVLDFHHNIVFHPTMREGTLEIMSLFDRIRATWTRKNITQKMHYSESTAPAVTPRDRRKHSARVRTLPPCAPDMDLMIEAKDKEQTVFELMLTFKLPGWHRFNDIVPHERDDEPRKAIVRKPKRGKKVKEANGQPPADLIEVPERLVSAEDFGMGGPEHRVYWPEGMEEWLRPKKREVKRTKKAKEEQEVVNDGGGRANERHAHAIVGATSMTA